MVDLYEASARNYPTNEEILTQLFMAYVRVGDYQKQQQVRSPTKVVPQGSCTLPFHHVDSCFSTQELPPQWTLLLLASDEHTNAGIYKCCGCGLVVCMGVVRYLDFTCLVQIT